MNTKQKKKTSIRTYRELGHFVQPLVIDNGTHNHGDTLVVGNLSHVLGDGAQRYWRTVDTRHKQTFQHDFVEM